MSSRTSRFACGLCTVVLAAVSSSVAIAQSGGGAPVQSNQPSVEVLAPEVFEYMKRGIESLKPGTVTVSDRLMTVADMGKYNVAIAWVTRPGGKAAGSRSLSHDKITEIYYVVRGHGTQVTGTMVNPKVEAGSAVVGPGTSSDVTPTGKSTRLGPGDMQIIPPGVGHGWSQIDEGGIDYITFRVDPDHILKKQ
jgi:mannose-6-phosphate isomerase-like protein (cupin superfamily)